MSLNMIPGTLTRMLHVDWSDRQLWLVQHCKLMNIWTGACPTGSRKQKFWQYLIEAQILCCFSYILALLGPSVQLLTSEVVLMLVLRNIAFRYYHGSRKGAQIDFWHGKLIAKSSGRVNRRSGRDLSSPFELVSKSWPGSWKHLKIILIA